MSGKDKSVYDKLMEIRQEIIDMHYKKGLEDGLDIKLTRIRENYNHAIERNCEYILSRSNFQIFKQLSKYKQKKEEEKENNPDGTNKNNRGFIEII